MELVFSGATFSYRRRDPPVIEDLNLSVMPGRNIVLGPNGAGKSTLLGVAASVFRLDAGTVRVGGVAPDTRSGRTKYRRRVAWMPQRIEVAHGLTAREQVAAHGWLSGMSKASAWEGAAEALRIVNLVDQASQRAAKLSGGQKARMGLAQALVHKADVMLLDEPTAALDPDQKESFVALLGDISDGRTVVVSTHDIGDLEQTYDQVIVMDSGQIRFDGSPEEFLASPSGRLTAVEAYRRAMGTR